MFPENAVPDCRDFGRNGTYLVYRKLAQDVAGFWRFIEHASDGLGGAEDIEEKHKQMRWLAAKFTGRWPGGAPLTLSPDQDDAKLEKENNFTYRPEDMNGNACPIGSHIRRSNPRDSILRVKDTAEQSFRTSGEHRIIRRGIGYGEPLFPAEAIENPHVPMGIQDDGRPRGLQFFAINASIKRQFEFIQQTWLNNSKFNGLEDNKDPISGDNDGLSHMEIQSDPLRIRITGVPRFVTVKGGAYFFLPSITALNFLANRPVVPEAG
jgi:deferrochelatase/peroxidase EfeB